MLLRLKSELGCHQLSANDISCLTVSLGEISWFERLPGKSSSLFLVDLNDVVLFHLQGLGSLVVVDTTSVEEETEGGYGYANSFTEKELKIRLIIKEGGNVGF